MILKSPSSQGNQIVEALQSKAVHGFSFVLPPAHKGYASRLWRQILEAKLPQKMKPEIPCKHTGHQDMIQGLSFLVTEEASGRVVQTSFGLSVSSPASPMGSERAKGRNNILGGGGRFSTPFDSGQKRLNLRKDPHRLL